MSATLKTFNEVAAPLGLSIGLFCNTAGYAAKVTPGQIVTRRRNEQPECSTANLEKARAALKKDGYKGKMNSRTRANVVGMLAEWFTALKSKSGRAFTTVNAAARQFTFCTLTLCSEQMHSDNYLKRHGLGRFIQELERKHGITEYFWRAEPQNNGNIHFHLLLAKEIPWQHIRGIWNKILKDLGYLALYSAKMFNKYCGGFKPSDNPNDKRSIEQQVKAYRAGVQSHWSNPNSTDIHRLNKTKNAAAYVCKYVSKDEGSRKIEGRIWGCSDNLRKLETPQLAVSEEFLQLMNDAADSGAVELIQLDHVAVYRGDIQKLLSVVAPELLNALEVYYLGVSDWLHNFTEPAT